jgi:hypothetical protein
MPSPGIDEILAAGAARGLLEHLLQGSGHLPPGTQADLAAFAAVSLRALLEAGTPAGMAARRLWERAPVIEAVPALFTLARRLEAVR